MILTGRYALLVSYTHVSLTNNIKDLFIECLSSL